MVNNNKHKFFILLLINQLQQAPVVVPAVVPVVAPAVVPAVVPSPVVAPAEPVASSI
jgi:hypothetical protein